MTARVLISFFSFLGVYLLCVEEANAQPHIQHVRYEQASQSVENTLLSSQHLVIHSKFNNWISWNYTLPQAAVIFLAGINVFRAQPAFHSFGVRDFFVRSGLSPPVHFV